VPGHADRVAEAGQAQPGRQVALIVIGYIQPVGRHFGRCEAYPFAVGGAVDVAVKPGMVPQDGKPAADNQHHQQEVYIMSQPQPGREAGLDLGVMQLRQRVDGDVRQAPHQKLYPSGGDNAEREEASRSKQREAHPDCLTPVFGVADSIPFRAVGFGTCRLLRYSRCAHEWIFFYSQQVRSGVGVRGLAIWPESTLAVPPACGQPTDLPAQAVWPGCSGRLPCLP